MMPRRLLNLLLAALAAAWFAAAPAAASFDEVGGGARGAGMADASVAMADDANAAFNNPAGLIQIGDRRLSTELIRHARGLDDGSSLSTTYLGYAQALRPGESGLGLGYRSFTASDLVQERTYLVGLGRRLRIEPMGWRGVWSVGVNVKLLERSFTGGAYATNAVDASGAASGRADPLLAGGGKSTAFGLDAGVLYQFGRNLNTSVGLAAINFNRPDVSIASGDRAPSILKLGAVRRAKWGLVSAEVRRARRLAGDPDTDLALGAERHFRISRRDAMSLRAGYAEGSRGYKTLTLGAAYHLGRFDFDYGISLPMGNLSATDGHQRIGFSVRFGSAPAKRPEMAPEPAPAATPDVEPEKEIGTIFPPMLPAAEAPATSTAPIVTELEKAIEELAPIGEVAAPSVEVLKNEAEALKRITANEAAVSTPPAPAKPAPVKAVPAPVRPPAKKAAPKTAPAPNAKPSPRAPAAEARPKARQDIDRAWRFYEEAVRRDVSDHERLEILESILSRHGDQETVRINKEIERIRKRLPKRGLGGK